MMSENSFADPMDKLETSICFHVDYAKSGRSKCYECDAKIPKGMIRMSIQTRIPYSDAYMDNWFHLSCFSQQIYSQVPKNENVRGLLALKQVDKDIILDVIKFMEETPISDV